MIYVERDLSRVVEKWLFKNKIIIIFGARQVGKTTIAKELLKKYGNPKDYYDCELSNIKTILESGDPYKMKAFFGDVNFIVLDEAQRVNNIGSVLKIFHDSLPEVQILATGSGSFDLANKINEPLTGRALEFFLYPFSISELTQKQNNAELQLKLNHYLRFGLYPEIYDKSENEAMFLLENLSSKYLYKDILEFEMLKKSELLSNLLKLIAFQVGNEVSKNELAVKLYTTRKTIERYLDLLEKTFVLYRLKSFRRNLRNEINKKEKIYFYDLGIRNALISRFNNLEFREDIGALWENFCIMERIKHLNNNGIKRNFYFWRTLNGKEIDFIEESNDEINAYEFKWKEDKSKIPVEFIQTYKPKSMIVITQNNFFDLVK